MRSVVLGVQPQAAVRDGDRDQAFRTYVVPELEVLYRVALRLTRSKPDAEDLVQDTVLRAYRAIDRLRDFADDLTTS